MAILVILYIANNYGGWFLVSVSLVKEERQQCKDLTKA